MSEGGERVRVVVQLQPGEETELSMHLGCVCLDLLIATSISCGVTKDEFMIIGVI